MSGLQQLMAEIAFDALNELETEAFVDHLAPLLQGERWLPERIADTRPFTSVRKLHKALFQEVMDAGDRKRCDLIAAHDGVLPTNGDAPPVSNPDVVEVELPAKPWSELSSEYRSHFGFDFILAAPPADQAKLRKVLMERMENSEADERLVALREISEITFERLEDTFRVMEKTDPED